MVGVQVRVYGASEKGELASHRGCMGWLPGGGSQCPAGRKGAMVML